MKILAIFQLISLGLSAVTQVEEMFKEAKSGDVKKETATKLFVDGMATAQAAGAQISDDLRAELAPVVPDLIEHAVTLAKMLGIIPAPAAGPDK